MSLSKRRTLIVRSCLTLLLAGLSLTACSTGPTGDGNGDAANTAADAAMSTKPEQGAYPVTIEDAFGSVTLDHQPKRVATLGWTDQDVALALGVVPVGATKVTWGGNAHGSTPWFDKRLADLGGRAPARYDDSDGVPFDEVAKTRPDLILATSSGLTRADYTKLSKIAPVLAYPGKPWQTRWQESVRLVGRALGLPDRAAELIRDTERTIKDTAAKYPQLGGTTFAFVSLSATDLSKIDYYTPTDNRTRLLDELGMRTGPLVRRLSAGSDSFYGSVSAERAGELRARVVITYVEKKSDLATFEHDRLLGQIPAFRTHSVVAAADRTASLGMSAPSPLSIPYTMSHFVPDIAAAAARAGHDTAASGSSG